LEWKNGHNLTNNILDNFANKKDYYKEH